MNIKTFILTMMLAGSGLLGVAQNVLPLSLEEIFIYELGGAGHELTDLVI